MINRFTTDSTLSSGATLFGLFWRILIKLFAPTDGPTDGLKMNPSGTRSGKTFLFTSESVGQGHSGTVALFIIGHNRTQTRCVDMRGHVVTSLICVKEEFRTVTEGKVEILRSRNTLLQIKALISECNLGVLS